MLPRAAALREYPTIGITHPLLQQYSSETRATNHTARSEVGPKSDTKHGKPGAFVTLGDAFPAQALPQQHLRALLGSKRLRSRPIASTAASACQHCSWRKRLTAMW
eukprot:6214031-Pleurochrysis_carterae.AAC.4